jgi:hypothetical protein
MQDMPGSLGSFLSLAAAMVSRLVLGPLIGMLPPVWLPVGLVGASGAIVAALVRPPSLRTFGRSLLAGLGGAIVGQALGGMRNLGGRVGDLHLLAAGLGALVLVGVVRRWGA